MWVSSSHFSYRAYVAPRSAGRTMTKGVVLDKVVNTLRRRGLDVKRGIYIEDFIFDAVVEMPRRRTSVIEVLSFASGQKNWAPVEHDAGHFLYAIQELLLPGIAVVQPPSESKRNGAATSHQRVNRWMHKAKIPTVDPQPIGNIDLGAVVSRKS